MPYFIYWTQKYTFMYWNHKVSYFIYWTPQYTFMNRNHKVPYFIYWTQQYTFMYWIIKCIILFTELKTFLSFNDPNSTFVFSHWTTKSWRFLFCAGWSSIPVYTLYVYCYNVLQVTRTCSIKYKCKMSTSEWISNI